MSPGNMPKVGTLAELLAAAEAAKRAPEPVQLPELEATVFVRWVHAAEMLEFVHETRGYGGGDPDPGLARKRMAATLSRFLCDENGERLVPTTEEAGKLLEALSLTTVKAITDAFEKLNGLGDREELQKN